MKYHVRGVDAQSGADRTIVVTADSENDAAVEAKSQGVFPTAIHEQPETPAALVPNPAPAPKQGRAMGSNDIICPNPNCGYIGPPKREPRGSFALGCLLSFLMLLPGLLYFAFNSGYNYVCPRCGVFIRSRAQP